MRLNR